MLPKAYEGGGVERDVLHAGGSKVRIDALRAIPVVS